MAAHGANHAYCVAVGDDSQVSWDAAPEWQRISALTGVDAVFAGKTPEQLHESWCDEKRATGWVYGVTKDAEAKTHPCLVPYSALPEFQKKKDILFSSAVRIMAELLGRPAPSEGAPFAPKDSLKVTTRPA